jgi:hypothetical protein
VLASFPEELTYHVCCAHRLEANRVAKKKETIFIINVPTYLRHLQK